MSDYRATTMHGPRANIDANGAVARPAYQANPAHPPGGYPINWWKVAFIAAAGTAALWYVTRKTEIPPLPTGAIDRDDGDGEPQS